MAAPTEKRKIRCVIYDCDGVLFDSRQANGKLYDDLRLAIGRPPLSEVELKYVYMHTVYEAVRFISGDDPASERKALDALKKIDLRDYIVFLNMEPNLIRTLEELTGRGILRAISTNRTTSMPHIMERFNLGSYFEMVVTALDVKHPKPHPESIGRILQSFDLNREDALFVGDSEVDQQTAKSAGVRFVAYRNREIPSDVLIEDHIEILGLIDHSPCRN